MSRRDEIVDAHRLRQELLRSSPHRLKDEGGTLGPRLGVTYKEKGEDFMVRKILNPALGNPSSTMPKFPLSEVEAKSIVSYIGEVMGN